MSIIGSIIDWVREAVTNLKGDTDERMVRDRADYLRIGKDRVMAAAKARGIEVDPDSIHDVLELLRVAVGEGFSGEKEFRRELALDLGIVNDPKDYAGTAKQNIAMLENVYIMVGQGGIKNPDATNLDRRDRPPG